MGMHQPIHSTMMYTITVFVIAVTATLTCSQFVCPKKNGLFKDEYQCDKYYECKNGVAREKLCDDGLVFDPSKRSNANRCQSSLAVDCTGREQLQPARPSGVCPRRNGVFEHPDPTVCHVMVSCIGGVPTVISCPADLIFDIKTGVCGWPKDIQREGCRRREGSLSDGFKCPLEKQHSYYGDLVIHSRYPFPNDCQKFYICMNGITPRVHSCTAGLAFNPKTIECEKPSTFNSRCNSDYQPEEEFSDEESVEDAFE